MSNPVVLEYSQLCGHHHEQAEDTAIPRKRNPGTVSIAPLSPAAPTTAHLRLPLWIHPPVLDASYPWNHNTWLKGAAFFPEPDNTFEVPPHCLVSWTHVRLLPGIQSWWWSLGSLRHPCGVSRATPRRGGPRGRLGGAPAAVLGSGPLWLGGHPSAGLLRAHPSLPANTLTQAGLPRRGA